MINLFNLFKKTVVVNLTSNTQLTLIPTTGGVNAVLVEHGDIFTRTEKCFFSTVEELVSSLNLTDDHIVRKLSKAF